MTEEMKASEGNRFVIVNGETNVIEATYGVEGDARKSAERLASNFDGIEFRVYQKVGSARLEPKVVWKGMA